MLLNAFPATNSSKHAPQRNSLCFITSPNRSTLSFRLAAHISQHTLYTHYQQQTYLNTRFHATYCALSLLRITSFCCTHIALYSSQRTPRLKNHFSRHLSPRSQSLDLHLWLNDFAAHFLPFNFSLSNASDSTSSTAWTSIFQESPHRHYSDLIGFICI